MELEFRPEWTDSPLSIIITDYLPGVRRDPPLALPKGKLSRLYDYSVCSPLLDHLQNSLPKKPQITFRAILWVDYIPNSRRGEVNRA